MVKKMYKISVLILTFSLFLSILPVNAINSENYGDDEHKASRSDGIYDLLIIAPQNFSKYIRPLVQHKNKFGIKSKCLNNNLALLFT